MQIPSRPPSHWVTGWVPGMPCDPVDLDYHLPSALHRAREAALTHLRPALRARGVSEAQWRLLRVLEASGMALSATEMARRQGGTDTNARLVGKVLVSRGLAVWQADAGRRINDWRSGPWLALTSDGRDTIARLRRDMARAREHETLPRVPAKLRRALVSMTDDLIRAVGGVPLVPLDPVDGQIAWHDLDLGLALGFRQARHEMLAPIRAILRAHELTEPQWRILRIMDFFGVPVTQRTIIRAGCFLGPEARHALDYLREARFALWDLTLRKTANNRRPKRFKMELSRGAKYMLDKIETIERVRLGETLRALTRERVSEAQAMLRDVRTLWLAGEVHPLMEVYRQQDAAGRRHNAIRPMSSRPRNCG